MRGCDVGTYFTERQYDRLGRSEDRGSGEEGDGEYGGYASDGGDGEDGYANAAGLY